MDYEFKSGKCDVSILSIPLYRIHNFIQSCGHSAMAHYSYFNRNYVNSIVGYGLIAEGRLAMDALRVNVLDKVQKCQHKYHFRLRVFLDIAETN